MSLSIGQPAPDFLMPDTEKKMTSLADFRGRNVILFFYPMAWTGTCNREMCTIQEDHHAYEGMNATPVGVSVDTLYALKRYKEDYKLNNIILLSDFNKDVIRAYDVVHHSFSTGYFDVAKRATFVIDGEGILRFIEVLPQLGDFPDMDSIKNAVKLLS